MNRIISSFLLILLLSLFWSCTKKNTLGGKLIGDDQGLFSEMVFSDFSSFTETDSRLRTDEDTCNVFYFGSYVHPETGKLDAAFFVQFGVPFPNLNPNGLLSPDSTTVDSVVVQLPFRSYYGNTAEGERMQRMKIYESEQQYLKGSSYFSDHNYKIDLKTENLIADRFVEPDLGKVVISETDTLPMLRIRLSKSFGEKLLEDTSIAKTPSSFQSKFKGLYIVPDNQQQNSGSGGIIGFDLLSRATRIMVYVTHGRKGKGIFLYNALSNLPKVNFYSFNRTGFSKINNLLQDTAVGSSEIFVQGFGSLQSRIKLNFIEQIKDSLPFLLNKAELIIEAEPNNPAFLVQPAILVPKIKSNNSESLVPDAFVTGEFNVNGLFNPSSRTYSFNITNYLYRLLFLDTEEENLVLEIVQSHTSPAIVKLKGEKNIKLKVTYTKIKD